MRERQSKSQVLVNGNEGDESNSPEISESDDNEDLNYVVEILDARYITKDFEFLCRFSNSKSLEWIPRSQCNNPYVIRKFFDNRREQMVLEDADERVETKNEDSPSTSSANIELTVKSPLMKLGRCSTIVQPEDSQPSTPSSNEDDPVECLSMENKIDGIHYTFGQKDANQKTVELAVNQLSNETNKNYMQKALSFSLNKVFDAQLEFRNTGIVVHSSKEQTNFTADSVMGQLVNGQPKSNSTSPSKFFREESNGKLEEIIRRLPRRSDQSKDAEVLTVKSPEKVEEVRRSPRKSEKSEDIEVLTVKSPEKVEDPVEEPVKSPPKIEEPRRSPRKSEHLNVEVESNMPEEQQTPGAIQLNGPKQEEKPIEDATPVKIEKIEEPVKESPPTPTKPANDVAPITTPPKPRQVPDLNLKTAFTPTKKRIKLMEKARAARLLKRMKRRGRSKTALATLSEVRKQELLSKSSNDSNSNEVNTKQDDQPSTSTEVKRKGRPPKMRTVDSNDKQEESPVIKIPSNQMDNQVKRISRSSKDSSSDNKQDDSQTSSLQLIDLQSQKSNEISEPNGSINKFEPSSKDSSSDNKQDDSQTSNSQFQQVQKRRGRPSLLQKRREGSLASLTSTASNPEVLIPKKRGRPFKIARNPTPTASSDNNQESSSQSTSNNKQDDSQTSNSQFQQVQKRRGRPPSVLKQKREGSLASLTSTASNPEVLIPKKRGRPFKIARNPASILTKIKDLDTKQDDSQTSSANDSRPNLFLQKKREGSLPSTASNLAPLPKKRGRPFKYLSLQHSTNKNLPTSSKEPKKRGRPFSKPKTSLNFNPISLQSQIPKRGRPPLLFNLKRRKAGLTSSTSSNPEALPKKRGRPFKYLSLKHSTNKNLPTSSKEPKKRGRKPRLTEDTTIAQ